MLSGPAFNELMSLAFLWPLLETDLRADPTCDRAGRPIVVATDAAVGEGGLGACIGRLYALSEEKGEYVRLEWAEAGSEEGGAAANATTLNRRAAGPPGILDRRALAAAFALSVEWKVQLRSPAASVRRAAPHQRARGPCNHEAGKAGRPEQSDRGVVGLAGVRWSVLEGQVLVEEAERRHSTRGGPAAPERVHAGRRLDSDLGQTRGCALSRCEPGGVACQGACRALA